MHASPFAGQQHQKPIRESPEDSIGEEKVLVVFQIISIDNQNSRACSPGT
jgi:hypothetical protein